MKQTTPRRASKAKRSKTEIKRFSDEMIEAGVEAGAEKLKLWGFDEEVSKVAAQAVIEAAIAAMQP